MVEIAGNSVYAVADWRHLRPVERRLRPGGRLLRLRFGAAAEESEDVSHSSEILGFDLSRGRLSRN